jgi:hypothetical protein
MQQVDDRSPIPADAFAAPVNERDVLLTAAAIEEALGQTIRQALDLSAWDQGTGLEQLLTLVPRAVTRSALQEQGLAGQIRRYVFGRLPEFPDAPSAAGVYRVPERLVRAARRHVLLSGGLTAADGVSTGHDALAATLVSLGVSLVRYDGTLSSWHTTFLRHDYDLHGGDPLEEVRRVLDRRHRRGSPDGGSRDRLTYLLRRGFMAAAERKALLERAASRWRMGHGIPAPLELLTGSGSMALLDEALPVLERLLLEETRWVFLPAGLSSRALQTLAGALEPGELAIFQKGKPMLEEMVDRGTYDAAHKRRVQAFAARAGEAFVVGGFRATAHAPGQLFIAHNEHALEAGVIALADAALQPHRGFPLLLELAALSARTGLGVEAYRGVVESAYARARANSLFHAGRLLGPHS